MENKREILDEIREISPLIAQIDRVNVLSVPETYFADLSANLLQYVKSSDTLILSVTPIMPYSLPNGYFNNLSDKIMAAVKQNDQELNEIDEELMSIAPELTKISRQNIYTVPETYFANFSVKDNAKEKAKVIKLNPIRRFISYAAAAVVIFIIAIGAFIFTGNNNHTQTFSNKIDVSKEVDNLTNEEIIEYLNTNSSAANTKSTINADASYDPEINEHLNEMKPEEIQEYLNQYAEPGEAQYEGI